MFSQLLRAKMKPELRKALEAELDRLSARVEAIKLLANKQDVPYQSMLKILLSEKVREALSLQSPKGNGA